MKDMAPCTNRTSRVMVTTTILLIPLCVLSVLYLIICNTHNFSSPAITRLFQLQSTQQLIGKSIVNHGLSHAKVYYHLDPPGDICSSIDYADGRFKAGYVIDDGNYFIIAATDHQDVITRVSPVVFNKNAINPEYVKLVYNNPRHLIELTPNRKNLAYTMLTNESKNIFGSCLKVLVNHP